MEKFVLFLNSRDKVVEYPLPSVDNRTVTIRLDDISIDAGFMMEVYDGIWKILSYNEVSVSLSNNRHIDTCAIQSGDIFKGVTALRESFAVFVCAVDRNIAEFVKYDITGLSSISLGRTAENDIQVDSSYISTKHAVISKQSGGYSLEDFSSNGTFLNGRKVSGKHMLRYGDIIYTIGFKIVFLGSVIAVNRKDIVKCRLKPFSPTEITPDDLIHSVPCPDHEYFSRSPRDIEPLFSEEVEIDSPPAAQRTKNQPLLFVVGPSVTMPLPILMSTFINSQIYNGSSMSYISTNVICRK